MQPMFLGNYLHLNNTFIQNHTSQYDNIKLLSDWVQTNIYQELKLFTKF